MRQQKTKQERLHALDQRRSDWAALPISRQLFENEQTLLSLFGNSRDLIRQPYQLETFSFMAVYLENMADRQQIEEFIISPMLNQLREGIPEDDPGWIQRTIQTSAGLQTAQDFSKVTDALIRGGVILFIGHQAFAYSIPLTSWKSRTIEEPQTQTMVRGPREGFVELIADNIPLLRRRISTPLLHFTSVTAGKITQTKLSIAYIEGLVNQRVLDHVRKQLDSLQADKLFETGMLEELLKENRMTPFPVFLSTERPDVAASALTEGKVVIMMEGTPFCIIAPGTFWSFFQAAEDYYQNYDIASLVRIVRLIAYIISLAFPATYIAVTTFHQELIPSELLISLAAQREGVPFPAFVEALLMEVIFEILREAGVRMPRPVGSAVSIVGAIVIGESAVAAGLVSPAIVIVVSLTAISSFVAPYYSFAGASRLLRFLLMVIASTVGIYGMIIFFIGLVIHLASVTSAGVPYFQPFAPLRLDEQKDGLLRMPLWISNTKLYKQMQKKQESGGQA
ncbi:spore germination protein [Bacillus sp. FJAT-42376]|uniref:spore germination protein n=1 Tax=Bacillus sp. FJAT-42376 TaxID=2014076 RepID=UPI000F4F6564|nr:spore germination protein [Bacillus sp. FJAT-42376]AZB43804.1 spore germination protein [Bacillus sp. FJAT-42376]